MSAMCKARLPVRIVMLNTITTKNVCKKTQITLKTRLLVLLLSILLIQQIPKGTTRTYYPTSISWKLEKWKRCPRKQMHQLAKQYFLVFYRHQHRLHFSHHYHKHLLFQICLVKKQIMWIQRMVRTSLPLNNLIYQTCYHV